MKAYGGNGYPQIEPDQYSVTQANVWTGHVLRLDGERRQRDSDDEWLLVFDSFEEAKGFVEKRIEEKPEIECWIRSFDGKYHQRFVKHGFKREPTELPSYQWWKFWKWRIR